MKAICFIIFYFTSLHAICQTATGSIAGRLAHQNNPVEFAHIVLLHTKFVTISDEEGDYTMGDIPPGQYKLQATCIGYQTRTLTVNIKAGEKIIVDIELLEDASQLQEVVITGTMKEVSKMNSPIPVEVYAPSLFLKNPTPNIFEALSMVNGVQPQINCNVCNTGDIHINGLEGPYTMILIDGMPIVSSLATVYGLAGIPNSLVKRIEVVKGPASTLYGSEAVGGVINIITKEPQSSPKLKMDVYGTTLAEYNADIAGAFKVKKSSALVGVNYYNFWKKWDINNDNFTDATLQQRASVFNKWSIYRHSGKNFSLAARYVHENRWGGELQWTPAYRGSDVIYGESIYTNRAELIGNYQLKGRQDLNIDFSYNYHLQDSYYGTTSYLADQHTSFIQLRWNKKIGQHDWLAGLPLRYTYYDDNTTGTLSADGKNMPGITFLPGFFIQDEVTFNEKFSILAGARYDHHNAHGNIFTPRISFKISPNPTNTIRLTGGSGYRVVNLFTEEHAALTGARQVIIKNNLDPERSWNVNFNYAKNILFKSGYLNLDGSLFYTYFTNKIIGDFISDPQKIIYDNLSGHAVSRGLTLNADMSLSNSFKVLAGITLMDVFQIDGEGKTQQQLHAPGFSGNFSLSYTLPVSRLSFDLTGRITGPMHLPVVPNDFRPSLSPWFSIVNLQVTKPINQDLEIYVGIKNLFNFLPQDPLLRPFDPFDKNVSINNPNGYTFDTSYNYAPLQGIRALFGVRWTIR
ncbi:MAG: TonB-dependent receptor [Cytophagales bacterium]|nr:TonB-dependent receptor [Cytophagales bacterium]MCA6387711.1 TonB-dependent receptor [Cytophagales bacterium]MCA6393344.1 TonB-dependent receptor [Cytophagales bacterium]MCA6394961.1 TonB-dependent receptor [Cytophagales bacterium]MCA6398791.1 TonB-dependent receptor [Cytophagales bacterium]